MDIVELTDSRSGSTAAIAVDQGMNCFRFTANVKGSPWEILWSDPNFTSGDERPSGSGIPLLFPFPGRLAGTEFTWGGRSYTLPASDGRGNAIHGFVYTRRWIVVARGRNHVVAEFDSADADLADAWPSTFHLRVDYRVVGTELQCRLDWKNTGQEPLPWGLGAHPYFRIPVCPGDRAEDYRVQIPAQSQWVLEEMLPTGAKRPLADPERYHQGLPFAEMEFDDVFGDLETANQMCRATIENSVAGRRIELAFADTFRELVIYTPGHREAVCVEPYSCVPGGWQLPGIDGGYRQLAPGEKASAWFAIAARAI